MKQKIPTLSGKQKAGDIPHHNGLLPKTERRHSFRAIPVAYARENVQSTTWPEYRKYPRGIEQSRRMYDTGTFAAPTSLECSTSDCYPSGDTDADRHNTPSQYRRHHLDDYRELDHEQDDHPEKESSFGRTMERYYQHCPFSRNAVVCILLFFVSLSLPMAAFRAVHAGGFKKRPSSSEIVTAETALTMLKTLGALPNESTSQKLWADHLVTREGGQLLIPETVESRFNAEVAPLIEEQLADAGFQTASGRSECRSTERLYVAFSVARSPRLAATLSFRIPCLSPSVPKECVQAMHLRDIRNISLQLPSKSSRHTFAVQVYEHESAVTDLSTSIAEDKTLLATVRGPFTIELFDNSELAVQKYCGTKRSVFADELGTQTHKLGDISLYTVFDLKKLFSSSAAKFNRHNKEWRQTATWDAQQLSKATFDPVEYWRYRYAKPTAPTMSQRTAAESIEEPRKNRSNSKSTRMDVTMSDPDRILTTENEPGPWGVDGEASNSKRASRKRQGKKVVVASDGLEKDENSNVESDDVGDANKEENSSKISLSGYSGIEKLSPIKKRKASKKKHRMKTSKRKRKLKTKLSQDPSTENDNTVDGENVFGTMGTEPGMTSVEEQQLISRAMPEPEHAVATYFGPSRNPAWRDNKEALQHHSPMDSRHIVVTKSTFPGLEERLGRTEYGNVGAMPSDHKRMPSLQESRNVMRHPFYIGSTATEDPYASNSGSMNSIESRQNTILSAPSFSRQELGASPEVYDKPLGQISQIRASYNRGGRLGRIEAAQDPRYERSTSRLPHPGMRSSTLGPASLQSTVRGSTGEQLLRSDLTKATGVFQEPTTLGRNSGYGEEGYDRFTKTERNGIEAPTSANSVDRSRRVFADTLPHRLSQTQELRLLHPISSAQLVSSNKAGSPARMLNAGNGAQIIPQMQRYPPESGSRSGRIHQQTSSHEVPATYASSTLLPGEPRRSLLHRLGEGEVYLQPRNLPSQGTRQSNSLQAGGERTQLLSDSNVNTREQPPQPPLKSRERY